MITTGRTLETAMFTILKLMRYISDRMRTQPSSTAASINVCIIHSVLLQDIVSSSYMAISLLHMQLCLLHIKYNIYLDSAIHTYFI